MTSRVLCCPTSGAHPDAMAALKVHAPQAEVVDVTDDRYAYWREISSRWTGERDLIIIEQDIEIGHRTIASLEECDQDWCTFAYPIFQSKARLRVGLGCTKISAEAQRRVSAAKVAEGFASCAQCRGKGCWWHLDGRIAVMLKRGGFFPHVHGDVVHHHDYGTEAPDGKNVGIICDPGMDMTPAQVIDPDLVNSGLQVMSGSARAAMQMANDLIRVIEAVHADPKANLASVGTFGSFPLGVIPVSSAPGAYDTDKVAQGYMPAYNGIADMLGSAAKVCEIGVFQGGSLATWRDLFPQGLIAGVDFSPTAVWPEGTIKIVSAQDDPGLPYALRGHAEQWDLIVDDASHDGTLTGATLELLWPLVSPGGFYVIEDWFVGFPEYAGACKSPEMLELAQDLLDRLRPGTDTESVSYRYGMAIIRKKV